MHDDHLIIRTQTEREAQEEAAYKQGITDGVLHYRRMYEEHYGNSPEGMAGMNHALLVTLTEVREALELDDGADIVVGAKDTYKALEALGA